MSDNTLLHYNQKISATTEWLIGELAKIRTGRATPSFLDSVQVSSYGSMMPLNQVASVTAEDARTLRVAPWDTSQIKDIEKNNEI